eukprot:CAMPEP_0119008240 /NCGR_PEP_ID=MMETSP1176-20130426/3556_1 /TAXON_ID=265551 /ORGANISM="Synedropsis recta cf, Strain CCMP1620" /LENGTH=216 /DNA_ID=CAMNT_0006960533 /DNA_START=75 /DNA_END=725 /DNA_ORIENTATION=+
MASRSSSSSSSSRVNSSLPISLYDSTIPPLVMLQIIAITAAILFVFILCFKPNNDNENRRTTTREQIIEAVNQLFLLTDEEDWDVLQKDILDTVVSLDMETLGHKRSDLTAAELCDQWKVGASKVDAVYHSCSNHHVALMDDDNGANTSNSGNTHATHATVKCWATTTHFKAAAVHGHTRDVVGSYELKLQKKKSVWRVTAIKFDLKYIGGNGSLQ